MTSKKKINLWLGMATCFFINGIDEFMIDIIIFVDMGKNCPVGRYQNKFT